MPTPQPSRMELSARTARRLWIVAMLDMITVAWMIAAGNWFDQTSDSRYSPTDSPPPINPN